MSTIPFANSIFKLFTREIILKEDRETQILIKYNEVKTGQRFSTPWKLQIWFTTHVDVKKDREMKSNFFQVLFLLSYNFFFFDLSSTNSKQYYYSLEQSKLPVPKYDCIKVWGSLNFAMDFRENSHKPFHILSKLQFISFKLCIRSFFFFCVNLYLWFDYVIRMSL